MLVLMLAVVLVLGVPGRARNAPALHSQPRVLLRRATLAAMSGHTPLPNLFQLGHCQPDVLLNLRCQFVLLLSLCSESDRVFSRR